jgi:predicted RNA-binding protein with PUA-like domain
MSPAKNSPGPNYWLVKTDPETFSVQDLAAAKDQTTFWNGVRNYQARNFMRDGMRRGDRVLVYHSGEQSAVVGTAVVAREAYPDHTALDPQSEYYDPKATRENPIWCMVDLRLESVFPRPLPLAVLRQVAELKAMELLRKGSRLSVQPVRKREFETILKLAQSSRGAPGQTPKKTSKGKAPGPATSGGKGSKVSRATRTSL